MFIRRFIVLMVLVLQPLAMAWAEELVPESTSPNTRFAISYEPSHSKLAGTPPQVWFINLHTHRHVSVQLVPSDDVIEKEAYRNHYRWALEDDRQMLWETLVDGIGDQQKGWGGAVNTSVIWSNHSQRAAVRVNVHKFTHTSVFQLRRGRFHYVSDSDE